VRQGAPIERLPAPPGFVFRPPTCIYGLGVTGDCMEPIIFEGDVVIIDPFRAPEPNDIVVFERDRAMFVKKLVSAGDGLALIPVNDATVYFPPVARPGGHSCPARGGEFRPCARRPGALGSGRPGRGARGGISSGDPFSLARRVTPPGAHVGLPVAPPCHPGLAATSAAHRA
jgi:hypothetical protein